MELASNAYDVGVGADIILKIDYVSAEGFPGGFYPGNKSVPGWNKVIWLWGVLLPVSTRHGHPRKGAIAGIL
eukprot:11016871-Prorocentrum_lima.AAC.1